MAIWFDTPIAVRVAALSDLAVRRVNVVFLIDLFNEGVNIPAVDTLLMLRPTDSSTLFLQQLGKNSNSECASTLPVKATRPSTGGAAPAAPPMTMFCGVARFSHSVYTMA